jgi:5-methylcytosine-specific restriction endonuclease McrA
MCCSPECHAEHLEAIRKAEKRQQRERWGSHYRSRARARGVAYEPINKPEVYARDGWICGICTESVDPNLSYPDLRSVSLDHVIPMSKGGPHLYHNVQCSHLGCNIAKSDRMEEEYAYTA